MTARKLGQTDLVAALENAVRTHDFDRRAAVWLLIEHGYWLRQSIFIKHVDVGADVNDRLSAWVSFDALANEVDRTPSSSSQRAILRLSCHLAGALPERFGPDDGWGWKLSSILAGFDQTNTRRALAAITYAATGRRP